MTTSGPGSADSFELVVRSRHSQYSQNTPSACTILATEAALRVLHLAVMYQNEAAVFVPYFNTNFLEEIVSSAERYNSAAHLDFETMFAGLSRFRTSLDARPAIQSLSNQIPDILKTILSQHLKDVNNCLRPFAVIITKPPETVSLVIVPIVDSDVGQRDIGNPTSPIGPPPPVPAKEQPMDNFDPRSIETQSRARADVNSTFSSGFEAVGLSEFAQTGQHLDDFISQQPTISQAGALNPKTDNLGTDHSSGAIRSLEDTEAWGSFIGNPPSSSVSQSLLDDTPSMGMSQGPAAQDLHPSTISNSPVNAALNRSDFSTVAPSVPDLPDSDTMSTISNCAVVGGQTHETGTPAPPEASQLQFVSSAGGSWTNGTAQAVATSTLVDNAPVTSDSALSASAASTHFIASRTTSTTSSTVPLDSRINATDAMTADRTINSPSATSSAVPSNQTAAMQSRTILGRRKTVRNPNKSSGSNVAPQFVPQRSASVTGGISANDPPKNLGCFDERRGFDGRTAQSASGYDNEGNAARAPPSGANPGSFRPTHGQSNSYSQGQSLGYDPNGSTGQTSAFNNRTPDNQHIDPNMTLHSPYGTYTTQSRTLPRDQVKSPSLTRSTSRNSIQQNWNVIGSILTSIMPFTLQSTQATQARPPLPPRNGFPSPVIPPRGDSRGPNTRPLNRQSQPTNSSIGGSVRDSPRVQEYNVALSESLSAQGQNGTSSYPDDAALLPCKFILFDSHSRPPHFSGSYLLVDSSLEKICNYLQTIFPIVNTDDSSSNAFENYQLAMLNAIEFNTVLLSEAVYKSIHNLYAEDSSANPAFVVEGRLDSEFQTELRYMSNPYGRY